MNEKKGKGKGKMDGDGGWGGILRALFFIWEGEESNILNSEPLSSEIPHRFRTILRAYHGPR